MPTTPISVSTGVQGVTNTTVYTVPAGRTAIVKAISGQGSTGAVSLTVSKQISGQNYVVVNNQPSSRTPATGGTETFNNNVLQAPLTLGATEQLKVYTASSNAYSLPSVSTAGSTAADGSNYTIAATLFANGIYMAVGNCTSGAYVATSTDAITWTQQIGAIPFGSSWNMLVCNGSVWVAANKNSTQGTVYYSSDNGVTWGAAVVVSGSNNCNQIVSNGSLFLISFNNGKVYSSSNGSSWTESTSYFTTVGSTNTPIYNVGWTGSHWIVNNQYGCLASADLTTWFSYAGAHLGRNQANFYSTEYSSAYGKYYTSKNEATVPSIFSSTNGLLWEVLLSGSAFTPFKVNCAGANTVLIAVGSSGTTSVLKSTNGSTWASATVQGSYAGPMWGLENGYYLTMLNQGTNDACMLSTDPTVSTGTTAGSTRVFTCRNAAADPSSGKWVGVGDDGTDVFIMGGTSGTNIGTTYNPTLTVGAAGTPVSVCWSAADGYFYMVGSTGRVYRSTAYNSTWTLVATSIGGSSSTQSIKAVGTTLYLVSSSQQNTVWISSTLTGGANWTQFNYASPNSSAYKAMGTVASTGYYGGEALGTDGTNLVWNNTAGNGFALTPSVSTSAMRMPISRAVGTAQTVNGNTFLYGAYNADYGPVLGYYTSTNVITTYGTFVSYANSGTYWMDNSGVPNKVNYIGGTYYVTSTGINGYIWDSTTPTTIFDNTTPARYASLGTTYAGITAVNPSNGWMIDGTNLVGSQVGQPLTAVCKTTTPSSYLYAATVTASIVEIS
jgi:hypothetical protein